MAKIELPESWAGVAEPLRALMAAVEREAHADSTMRPVDILKQGYDGEGGDGMLNEILGHVAFYCIDHELPPLTSIVVNARGVPGHGIPAELATIDAQREDVYAHDWYDIYPPDETELVAAFEKPR